MSGVKILNIGAIVLRSITHCSLPSQGKEVGRLEPRMRKNFDGVLAFPVSYLTGSPEGRKKFSWFSGF